MLSECVMDEELYYSRYDNPFDGDNPDGYVFYGSSATRSRDQDLSKEFGFNVDTITQNLISPSPTSHDAPSFLNAFNSVDRVEGGSQGQIIDNFKLGEIIGMGAFSVVRECVHTDKPDMKLAVKIIDKKKCDQDLLEYIRREIKIWEQLSHPNIIQFHHFLDTKYTMYIFSELAEKGSLFDHVVSQPTGYLLENECRKMFKQITSAIDYLHSKNILHGDIKLDNILLDSEMNVKLCDFGLSHVFSSADNANTPTDNTSFGGTLMYSSPEIIQQANCKESVGLKADTWSLGVTLFAMAYGQFPFDDSFEPRLKHTIVTGVYSFPQEITTSNSLRDLIKGMLTINTKDRMSISEVISHEWN